MKYTNIKRSNMLILCLFLLSFTGVVHGTETILDDQVVLSGQMQAKEYPFDLPAGDNITIYIQALGDPIDFWIENATDTLYTRSNINNLDEVWTVPAEGSYIFAMQCYVTGSNVHIVLGSEIIPEFPTWTSMLLILIALTIGASIYKRRIFKTQIH